MKLHDIGIITALCALFLVVVWFTMPTVYTYRFDSSLISRYQRSQDIPHEVHDRIFLSDSDIHIAAGYLYTGGSTPTSYNFQHPPLLKYFFGWGIRLFHTPYPVQMIFALLYIALLYLFARHMGMSSLQATIASLLLIIDPLFLDVSSQALLDLGQSVFALAYVFALVSAPHSFIIQGVLLGLFAGSKFWTTALLFFGIAVLYEWITTKKIRVKHLLVTLGVASLVFSAIYAKEFMAHRGLFNIVFFQLKMLKYWLHQSVSSMPGATVLMFVTGYVQEWWGMHRWTRITQWTPAWPIALGFTLTGLRKNARTALIHLIPIGYMMYLIIQTPFPRYFLIILPYLYIVLVQQVTIIIMRKSS